MKKLLAILGAVGLTATEASSVVACNKSDNSDTTDKVDIKDVTVSVAEQLVADSKKITDKEATAATKAIKVTVQETLVKVASEVTDADYTIAGIEAIKKDADVSKPVTLTVKANADSTKITGDSKAFDVTFKSDQEVVTAIKTTIDSLQGDDLKISPVANTEDAAKNAVEKVIDGKIKLNGAEINLNVAKFTAAKSKDEPGSMNLTVEITKGTASATSKELTFELKFHDGDVVKQDLEAIAKSIATVDGLSLKVGAELSEALSLIEKQANNANVTIEITSKNPLVAGDNNLTVKLTDKNNAANVKDGVTVNLTGVQAGTE